MPLRSGRGHRQAGRSESGNPEMRGSNFCRQPPTQHPIFILLPLLRGIRRAICIASATPATTSKATCTSHIAHLLLTERKERVESSRHTSVVAPPTPKTSRRHRTPARPLISHLNKALFSTPVITSILCNGVNTDGSNAHRQQRRHPFVPLQGSGGKGGPPTRARLQPRSFAFAFARRRRRPPAAALLCFAIVADPHSSPNASHSAPRCAAATAGPIVHQPTRALHGAGRYRQGRVV